MSPWRGTKVTCLWPAVPDWRNLPTGSSIGKTGTRFETKGEAVSQHPALPYLRNSEKGKIVTAAEAVRLIRDGDTVATGGFVGIGFAEEIALALEERYLASQGDAPTGTANRAT